MTAVGVVAEVLVLFAVGYVIVTALLPKGKLPPQSPGSGQSPQPGLGEETPGSAWHEVLQVSADAGIEEIRQAYKTLIGQYQSDKVSTSNAELRALAEAKSKQIEEAYREAVRLRNSSSRI